MIIILIISNNFKIYFQFGSVIYDLLSPYKRIIILESRSLPGAGLKKCAFWGEAYKYLSCKWEKDSGAYGKELMINLLPL